MFENQHVLVTGGTGMIGRFLVELLIERGARVRISSLDQSSRAHPGAEFLRADLTDMATCMSICQGVDYLFHLAGVKGSPKMTQERPASFFVPVLRFNTNMMEAARLAKVKWYLYTSTVGVYQPAEILREDDVWQTFPSPHDWFSGWAKRMGELQAEAYRIEYGWDTFSIVRPANVYGPYDNFDPNTAMVIPSLIRRAVDGENPLRVWGDGTPVRDFIHARDVARGMMFAVERQIREPLNLGSGTGASVKQVVDHILENLEQKPEVIWDPSQPAGDRKRVLDTSRARGHGFEPATSLQQGIAETIAWYRDHRQVAHQRYNIFTEG